jgi:hypothetical protein
VGQGREEGDEGVLRALVAKLGGTVHGRHDPVLDSVLDRDTWSVSDQAFKAILTEDAVDARPGRIYARERLVRQPPFVIMAGVRG